MVTAEVGTGVARESHETALRLYSLTVDMADRLSARRAGANNFFLAVQSALTTVLAAFAVKPAAGLPAADRFLLSLALVAGLVLAAAWWLLLTSYRRLSTAKFAVISEIESSYFKIQPYTTEWQQLKKQSPVTRNPFTHISRVRDRYAELGVVEQVVPTAFAILYALIAYRLWNE